MSVKEDVNRLNEDFRNQKRLQQVPDGEPLGESLSEGLSPEDEVPGIGGGIASPLIEQEGSLIWHPEYSVTSSEGLLVQVERSEAGTVFTDADGVELEVNYLDRAP